MFAVGADQSGDVEAMALVHARVVDRPSLGTRRDGADAGDKHPQDRGADADEADGARHVAPSSYGQR